MILTALVLFCCTTVSGDSPRIPPTTSTSETKVEAIPDPAVRPAAAKPDSPMPKAMATPEKADLDLGTTASEPAVQPYNKPIKPAFAESYETPRQRRTWIALMVLGHGTAAFDAWTTRRAISGGYGVEGNPLERPFAHSGAIYATTQVTPLVMDFLGHYMMRSSHPLIRRAWWVPQSASASVSLGAGIHNYTVVP